MRYRKRKEAAQEENDIIKKIRQAKFNIGFNNTDLYLRTGIDKANIERILSRKVQTSFNTIIILAKAVNLKLEINDNK